MSVIEAQNSTTPNNPVILAQPDTIPYIVAMGIALILAVAIATVLILRKH